jgi:membrane protease YdiL (CAAX protease family)
MILIRQVFRVFWPEASTAVTALREALFWVSAVGLVWIIRRGERLPFSSIGLGTSQWWKSIAWGLVIAVLCGGSAVLLVKLTGYGQGPASKAFEKLPLWLITSIVFRAGILEELFYRGYAMERLQSLGFARWLSIGIPLAIFAVAHWTGGWANVLIALVLGGILAGFYLWRRDLVSNMFAHTLVDFVANVLPKLVP